MNNPPPPLGDLGVDFSWQSWKAATRNPVEALRYECFSFLLKRDIKHTQVWHYYGNNNS